MKQKIIKSSIIYDTFIENFFYYPTLNLKNNNYIKINKYLISKKVGKYYLDTKIPLIINKVREF